MKALTTILQVFLALVGIPSAIWGLCLFAEAYQIMQKSRAGQADMVDQAAALAGLPFAVAYLALGVLSLGFLAVTCAIGELRADVLTQRYRRIGG